ncbi:MAG: response regulator [Limisphaerales bacterium]
MREELQTVLSSSLATEEAASFHALNDRAYAAFQAQLRDSFLKEAPQIFAAIREQLKGFVKSESRAGAGSHLIELHRIVQLLRENARIAGFVRLAHMTGALAMLFRVLKDRPETINPSTVRTAAHTVDFLGLLFENAGVDALPSAPPLILAIDDETSLILLVCAALQQSGLRAIGLDDPTLALRLLKLNSFDLIFLDISMPKMDGFELCTQLRVLPGHKQTPLVFLTGLPDFENRAQSILRGGNDLIAKPFLPAELIVKALTCVYRSQLQAANPVRA